MSIKFPDMQVLVSRTDQIPKVMREGDHTGAGKIAPQIVEELKQKEKRVIDSKNSPDVKNKRDESSALKKRTHSQQPKKKKSHLDIRV